MAEIRRIDLLIGRFVLLAIFFCHCESKPLDGYKFPVYTTESCPRNQTEWSERSSAINCTESNGYLCLPNEDLTELLEFCYFDHRILIEKGLCMFLRKRFSIVDDYSCRNFVEGCPNSTYRIYKIHIYRSCVRIGNGCFIAEPTCIRTNTPYHLSTIPGMTASEEEINNTMHEFFPFKERNHWVGTLTLLVVGAMICIPVIMFCQKIKSKDTKTTRIKKYYKADNKNSTEKVKWKMTQDNFLDMEFQKNSQSSLQLTGDDDNVHKENIANLPYLSCKNRHDSNAPFSLNTGTGCNSCSAQGFKSFAYESDNRHESTAQLLVKNDANVNVLQKNGPPPLLLACSKGNDNIVEFLIKNGADVNLCDSQGFCPLAVASQNGHENTVQLLVGNGANVNLFDKNGSPPLCTACGKGHANIVEFLIKNGADVNLCDSKGFCPLAVACIYGHENTVQLLVENGANVNLFEKNGLSPLYLACCNGHDNVVEFLIKNGADVNLCNSKGFCPLAVASKNGHENTVQRLVENGANVNLFEKDGPTPLGSACCNGHDNIVEFLIKNGADVNLCDSIGCCALAVASENGHENTVQLLVENGANVNLFEKNGPPPL